MLATMQIYGIYVRPWSERPSLLGWFLALLAELEA